MMRVARLLKQCPAAGLPGPTCSDDDLALDVCGTPLLRVARRRGAKELQRLASGRGPPAVS